MLYLLTKVVNRHAEFRTSINEIGEIGIYDSMLPCYTVFNKERETFSNIWTPYSKDYAKFFRDYEKDIRDFEANEEMRSKPNTPHNSFNVSMIPWVTFEGFNLNLQKGYRYLLPIFTMGKYYNENNKVLLPLAVQVHHAVCDGFHISRLINELQDLIHSFEINK